MLNQLRRTSISNSIVSCATLIKVITLRSFKKNKFEITPEQFIILDALFDNDESKDLYQRQLGILLGKDRANIARLIGILEKKGLVEKISDSNGRQIYRISVTRKGVEIRNKIYPVISEIRKSYLHNIDYDELKKCLETLNKIKDNISENTKLKI